MSRRLLAVLIAGAIAAAGSLAWSGWPPHSDYLPILICFEVIGSSFLVAGIAAWVRWPAIRLGLLFTIAGYLYLLPYILVNLANPVAFTIGNLGQGIYTAAVAHLGLAWPTGRLRSRFECGVVIAEYVTAVGFSAAAIVFWNPAFSGCDASCPVNVLLVGDGSRSAGNAINTIGGFVGLVLTGIVLTLIVRHWRSARGWSRRAMVPLVWLAVAVGTEQIVTGGALNLPLSSLVSFGLAPLVMLAGPALFVISTARARTAGGALGTAIVDLEPGASPGRLREALSRALGDSTLQLAFRRPDGSGYLDTASQAVDVDRPGPGRVVARVAGSDEAVLVYDEGLALEPQLVKLTAAAASMALEHARLQAEVQAQLEQVRASRTRIVEAGDADRVGQQGSSGGADRAARTGPRDPSRSADRDRANRGDPGPSRALTGGHHHHRGAGRAVPGRDRGHRVLCRLRGADQRGQARDGRQRRGDNLPAARTASGGGQRRRGRWRPARGGIGAAGSGRPGGVGGRRATGRQPARLRDPARGGPSVSMTPGPKDQTELRVIIAEDTVLLREGLRRVLTDAGLDMAGTAGDAEQLLSLVAAARPDVVLTDIRMPPTQTTEGLQAALEIRRQWPGTAVIVLSQHVETEHLFELLGGDPRGIGYVLKERVADIAQFTDAIRRASR